VYFYFSAWKDVPPMPSEHSLLEVDRICKTFALTGIHGTRPLVNSLVGKQPAIRKALDDISFSLGHGEALGVMGRNGSGKSTLLKILAGIIDPSSGTATINGQVGALLEVGSGAHPDLSGWDNMRLAARLLGVNKADRQQYYDKTARFCELGEKLSEPARWYSSGQFARLGFAMAAMAPTDLLLVDEALAAGDAKFQLKCFDFFYAAKAQGRSFIFVSHALPVLRDLCEKGLVLQSGKALYTGSIGQAVERYETTTLHTGN
jgi:ABC-type polysaccharide/polyol phosphate transport system ATPase subunit